MRKHLQVQGGGGVDEPDEELELFGGQVQTSTESLDDILDEIDQVLATDAQSLVTNFVQKGGQ